MKKIDKQRAEVVRIARTYLGTRYHNNAAVRGHGVDCATLLELSFTEAKVVPPFQIGNYSSQFHLHSDEPLYENSVKEQGGREIPDPSGVGDIVVYFQGKQFAHGAIITELEPLRIIHAYAPSRCVVEGVETEFGVLSGVERKFFTAW